MSHAYKNQKIKLEGNGFNIRALIMPTTVLCLVYHLIQILSQVPDLGSNPTSTTYKLCDLGRCNLTYLRLFSPLKTGT